MNSKTEQVLTVINDLLLDAAVEEDKAPMEGYMKGHFEFYGVKAPIRKDVLRKIKPSIKELDTEETIQLVEALWLDNKRESQYMGIDILVLKNKYLEISHLSRIEKLITEKSWWDSVDPLASDIAGGIFVQNEHARMNWIEKWNNSDNMWLNRSALIHQLKYKKNVDLDLLFVLVESHIGSKTVFINKASGWALRQASKYYPQEIRMFIENRPHLSNLTKREGTKYL